MARGIVGVGRTVDGYRIRIVMRDHQGQIKDDWHATVGRMSDGVELIWISDYLWVLKLRLRPRAIKRAFKRYDKRQKKLARVREFEV